VDNSLHYSIGKGKRPDLVNNPMSKIVPGPGTYNSAYNKRAAAPKWGFGSGKRPDLAMKSMSGAIGPGDYLIPNKAIEGKQYSMGGVNPNEKKYHSISPGPGTYESRFNKEVNLKYSLGQKFDSGMISKSGANFPGPGGYEPRPVFKNDGNIKFGT